MASSVYSVMLNHAHREFIAAREAAAEAAKALAEAEDALKRAFATAGVDSYELSGQMIRLVRSERTKYDTEALTALVAPAMLAKVTKVEVDSKKFRAAVELGAITEDIVDAVTTITEVEAVRVYDSERPQIAMRGRANAAA